MAYLRILTFPPTMSNFLWRWMVLMDWISSIIIATVIRRNLMRLMNPCSDGSLEYFQFQRSRRLQSEEHWPSSVSIGMMVLECRRSLSFLLLYWNII